MFMFTFFQVLVAVFEVPVARHGLARKPAVAGPSTMSMVEAFPTG